MTDYFDPDGTLGRMRAEISRLHECLKERDGLCRRLEAENARLREALEAVVQWADDLHYFSERGSELAPVFQFAKAALAAAAQVGEITGETIGNMSVRKFQDQQLVAATIERCAEWLKASTSDNRVHWLADEMCRALATEGEK